MADNPQADALVEEGLKLYKEGKLDAALSRWTTALGMVKDHPKALEYYQYVLDNRTALEESFQLAADYTGEDDGQVSLSEVDDEEAEFDHGPSSFAGGVVAPGADGRRGLEPEPTPGDPSVLEPLGEDDATPVVSLPVEEPTSRIGRELLEAQLEESRGDEEDGVGGEEGATFDVAQSTPVVGGLPHTLLQEAAEDGAHDAASKSAEDKNLAPDNGSGDDFIVLSDDDYAREVDLSDDESSGFTWDEGSIKAEGGSAQDLEIDLSSPEGDDAEDELLLTDNTGDVQEVGDAEVVEESMVEEASPVDDLLELTSPDDPEEEDLIDDDGSSAGLDDPGLEGSGPDIPDLPRIPLTAPFDGLQDSSEDKSWVKEELERVSSAQELDADLPPMDSDDSLGDMDGLEVISSGEAGAPISEIRSMMEEGKLEEALTGCERILKDVPDDKLAVEAQEEIQEQLQEIYGQRIGDLEGIPTVQVPRHEIVWQNLDHRTGFLLSRIDGFLSYQDIIDVSGMEQFEAFRIIVGLMDEEIIGVN